MNRSRQDDAYGVQSWLGTGIAKYIYIQIINKKYIICKSNHVNYHYLCKVYKCQLLSILQSTYHNWFVGITIHLCLKTLLLPVRKQSDIFIIDTSSSSTTTTTRTTTAFVLLLIHGRSGAKESLFIIWYAWLWIILSWAFGGICMTAWYYGRVLLKCKTRIKSKWK